MSSRTSVAAVAVVLAGCAPMYLAPAANVPLPKAEDDVHLGLLGGTNGVDVSAAYAPINHLVVLGAGSFARSKSHDHDYGELGAGFFSRLGGWGVVELLGGAGLGRSRGQSNSDDSSVTAQVRGEGTYVRPFAQADIALTTRAVDFGLMLREAYLRYDFDSLSATTSPMRQEGFFFEPALFLRAGWDVVKVEAQLGLVIPQRASEAPNLVGNPLFLHLALGLGLDLGRLLRESD